MKSILLLTLILVIALQGCIYSLHPLYTSDDLTFDKRLVGVWKAEGSKDDLNTVWKLENLLEKDLGQYQDKAERADKEGFKRQFVNQNTYLLTFKENGEAREFNANLIKIENNLFLDLAQDH